MLNKVGLMQGRLSSPVGGKFSLFLKRHGKVSLKKLKNYQLNLLNGH